MIGYHVQKGNFMLPKNKDNDASTNDEDGDDSESTHSSEAITE